MSNEVIPCYVGGDEDKDQNDAESQDNGKKDLPKKVKKVYLGAKAKKQEKILANKEKLKKAARELLTGNFKSMR